MSNEPEAPERIWICSHLGEYGKYYPEAVEAEGEYGGVAISYVPEALSDAKDKRGNDIAVLKSDLKKAQARISELEAELEAERDERAETASKLASVTMRYRLGVAELEAKREKAEIIKYIAGAKAGWNCALADHPSSAEEAFQRLIRSREGHLAELKGTEHD